MKGNVRGCCLVSSHVLRLPHPLAREAHAIALVLQLCSRVSTSATSHFASVASSYRLLFSFFPPFPSVLCSISFSSSCLCLRFVSLIVCFLVVGLLVCRVVVVGFVPFHSVPFRPVPFRCFASCVLLFARSASPVDTMPVTGCAISPGSAGPARRMGQSRETV